MQVRALEFYSGIGGLHLALKRSRVDGTVVQAFDWDQTACQVYAANHGSNIVKKVDISSLTARSCSRSQHVGLWLLSPACQPYTVLNPNAAGAADPRAKSFLHLIQSVLPDLVSSGSNAHPTHLLVENVAGFETSSTRQILLSSLRSLGYTTMEFLLTPLQFGIPNSRLRYYLLAKLTPFALPYSLRNTTINADQVWRHIPGRHHCDWVDPRSQCPGEPNPDAGHPIDEIRKYLDDDHALATSDPHLHAVPDRILQKWGRLFDIVLPSSQRTCCFTRGYTQLVERSGSILQMNDQLDTTAIFENFLQAQANNVQGMAYILSPLKLRYFSPGELLRLFDFNPSSNHQNHLRRLDEGFLWPEGISTKTKYRLIGNSVNVRVVRELIDFLYEEM